MLLFVGLLKSRVDSGSGMELCARGGMIRSWARGGRYDGRAAKAVAVRIPTSRCAVKSNISSCL